MDKSNKPYDVPLAILLCLMIVSVLLSIVVEVIALVFFSSSGVLDWFMSLIGF